MTQAGLTLPKFQLEDDLGAMVAAIRADTVSGPMRLARLGAEVVLRLTEKAYYERPLHIWIEVQGLARALLEARPDCMPLANLASATVTPLPELYGRGKDEGARMRADLRARTVAWLSALEARAERIDALRSTLADVVTAHAIDLQHVYGAGPGRYVIAGAEKFVPPNYSFCADDNGVLLDQFEGVITGDADAPWPPEKVRATIGTLRFETTLL